MITTECSPRAQTVPLYIRQVWTPLLPVSDLQNTSAGDAAKVQDARMSANAGLLAAV